ncbi:hypothetical protein EYZ11_012811 [Aspergillus tanneri]|uniref:Uncharacterized protein n=1 Tax=Aspergillus tanneri TaxID=1220188 RepID=A0A4S3IZA6_9EURO|nr:hypothetical protein EYZ11_012811 [Aspergillus tanneri]
MPFYQYYQSADRERGMRFDSAMMWEEGEVIIQFESSVSIRRREKALITKTKRPPRASETN